MAPLLKLCIDQSPLTTCLQDKVLLGPNKRAALKQFGLELDASLEQVMARRKVAVEGVVRCAQAAAGAGMGCSEAKAALTVRGGDFRFVKALGLAVERW